VADVGLEGQSSIVLLLFAILRGDNCGRRNPPSARLGTETHLQIQADINHLHEADGFTRPLRLVKLNLHEDSRLTSVNEAEPPVSRTGARLQLIY
jgi:hypothetical protein